MLSVVIPAYNAEHYIGAAIESILSQTYSEFELIIVDDGSTDSTLSVMEPYAKRDGRIRIVSQENGGISRATNRGIGECGSDWVALLDNDDIAAPRRLERQVASSRECPHVVAWATHLSAISSDGRVLNVSHGGPRTDEDFIALRARGRSPVLLGTTFLLHKPTVLAAGGFDPRFDGCQDTDILDRMAAYGPVLVVPEPLVWRRVHGGNYSLGAHRSQHRKLEYVALRSRARITGEELPTLEEFLGRRGAHHWWSRARTEIDVSSRLLYRKAGLQYVEGHFARAALAVGLAAVLRPHYIVKRLWCHRLCGRARAAVKGAGPPVMDGPLSGPSIRGRAGGGPGRHR